MKARVVGYITVAFCFLASVVAAYLEISNWGWFLVVTIVVALCVESPN